MTPTNRMAPDQSGWSDVNAAKSAEVQPRSNKTGLLVLFMLAVLFIGSTAYYYRENAKLKNNPQQAAQEEINSLIAKVSKLILLPQGETPIVATVVDPDKLKKQQSFFTNASVGDKILIYGGAREAYMYNPKLNKIIQVAPIVFGDQGQQSQPSTETSPAYSR